MTKTSISRLRYQLAKRYVERRRNSGLAFGGIAPVVTDRWPRQYDNQGLSAAAAIDRDVRLLPGRALPEKEVAAILNVSKTPVREAIIRLWEEGLIKVVPQGGTFVATIEVQRYIEACFIRFRLEAVPRRKPPSVTRSKTSGGWSLASTSRSKLWKRKITPASRAG